MPSATANTELFDKLADLLVYPVEGYERRFDEALEALETGGPGSAAGGPAEKLAPLARLIGSVSLEDLEELYTRTFDINPACTLEIGWQLYGEDYNRGSFLVRMRELMRELGVEESTELPDHLMHILPVLGRLQPADAADFSHRFVQPALDKMLEAFADRENPYRGAVEAIQEQLAALYGPSDVVAGSAAVRQTPYDGMPGGHAMPPDLDLSAYEDGEQLLRKPAPERPGADPDSPTSNGREV